MLRFRTSAGGHLSMVALLVVAVALFVASLDGTAVGTGVKLTGERLPSVTIAEPVNVLTDAPLYIAISRGLFRKHGVNVKLVNLNNPQSVEEGLTSGSVQLGTFVSFNVVEADAKGASFISIMNTGLVPEQLCVSKSYASAHGLRPGMSLKKMMEAIKGASLGVSGFGSPTIVPLYYLINRELGVADPASYVKIVNLGSLPAAQTAFEHGSIDILSQSPPTCQVAGGETLVTFGELPIFKPMEYASLTGERNWVSQHKAIDREIAQGFIEANKYVLAHPKATAELLHKSYFPTDSVTSLEGQINGYLKKIMEPDGQQSTNSWKAVNKAMILSGILKSTPSPKEGLMWTDKYLPAKG